MDLAELPCILSYTKNSYNVDTDISTSYNVDTDNSANMNIKQTPIYIKRMSILINGFIRTIENRLKNNQIVPDSINEICYTYYYNGICYLSLNGGLIVEDIDTNTIFPCNIDDINPEQYEYIYITNTLKEKLYNGITILKYGKHGKPKYKSIQIIKRFDVTYLQWYSTKKSVEECKINLEHITQIAFGSESQINKCYKNSKDNIISSSSFTFYYKSVDNNQEIKSITMTAETEQLALTLCFTVQMLCQLQKKNKELLILTIDEKAGNKPWLMYIQTLERNSFKVFNNRKSLSCELLKKEHDIKKRWLQKCVDFVMNKRNYRAIANAQAFDPVKMELETLDNFIIHVKSMLPVQEKSILVEHAEILLIHCEARLYALKEKLNSLSKNNKKHTLRF